MRDKRTSSETANQTNARTSLRFFSSILDPRMAEAADRTRRLFQFGHDLDLGSHHFLEHELRQAHAALDDEVLLAVVDQDETHHPAVVTVDGAGGVDQRD